MGLEKTLNYVIDESKLAIQASRFVSYVKYNNQSDSDYIDFVEKGILVDAENYKSGVFEDAKKALGFNSWTPNMIGTGKILEKARNAIALSGNLLYNFNRPILSDCLNPEKKEYYKEGSEQVIYDIYKSSGDAETKVAFENAKKLFSGTYCRLAYLFFIKNNSKYLPISPERFDHAFIQLGIIDKDTGEFFRTSGKCSWENYSTFNEIISAIRDELPNYIISREVRLIDAHTFLWIIGQDSFINWKPAKETEAEIEKRLEDSINREDVNKGIPRRTTSEISNINRSREVVRLTRLRANGICQLCKKEAPFRDKKGNPYLEAHHIIWLARGGEDSTRNSVALCPNCHTKMHIVDDESDVEYLLKIANE